MATETLRPTGDLAKILNRQPTAARNYTAVDESAADDTDYVYGRDILNAGVMNFQDQYTLGNMSASGTLTISSVLLRYRGQTLATGTTKQYTAGIVVGATPYLDTYRTTTAWTTWTKSWATNPGTGIAWTKTDVDALKVAADVKVYGSAGSPAEARISWIEVVVTYVLNTEIVAATAYIPITSVGADVESTVIPGGCPSAVAADPLRTVSLNDSVRTVLSGSPALTVAKGSPVITVESADPAVGVSSSPAISVVANNPAISVEDGC